MQPSTVNDLTPKLLKQKVVTNNQVPPGKLAAVSILFRHHQKQTQICLIKRTINRNDPWSGHLAFPGGLYKKDDTNTLHTAIRETKEETGIQCDVSEFIGRFEAIETHPEAQHQVNLVVPHLFWLSRTHTTQHINTNEVEQLFWVNLNDCLAPSNQISIQPLHTKQFFPATKLKNIGILWGLTWRLLMLLITRLNQHD